MFVEDGTGQGYRLKIDSLNRAVVASTATTELHVANERGDVYCTNIDAVAASGATNILYISNTSNVPVHIMRISLYSSVAGVFRLEKVTGTAVGGTEVAKTALKLDNVVSPTFSTQTAASITGLSVSSLILLFGVSANYPHQFCIEEGVLVSPGTAIALKAPGAATVSASLTWYLAEE